MKKTFIVNENKTLEVKQNMFTGLFTFSLGDHKFVRVDRQRFVLNKENEKNEIVVSGNFYHGFRFTFNGEEYILSTRLEWYVIILGFVPLILSIVLGSVRELAEAGFYYVGGAIGGAIGGAFTGLSIYLAGYLYKRWQRLLLALMAIILSFGLCFMIGNIIAAVSK